jgi:ketol-acid reductoisomerase
VPTLTAVHPTIRKEGWAETKACHGYQLEGHRSRSVTIFFVAEVKSDLMGEQTILYWFVTNPETILSLLIKWWKKELKTRLCGKLIQYGWETVTEAKHGGITNMMDRLSNPTKVEAFRISRRIKDIIRRCFQKHMDDQYDQSFSKTMMEEFNDDKTY